jgi:hypothetical protein
MIIPNIYCNIFLASDIAQYAFFLVSHTDRDGSSLRRQLRAFKSLKEVLLSHDGYDGGPYMQQPGQTIVEDWDVQLEPPNYEDWDESEDEDFDPYDDLP